MFLLAGALTGRILLFLLIGVSVFAAAQLWNLHRLRHWLHSSPTLRPPEAPPLWSEVYARIHEMQQRNRRQKRKLGALLSKFQTSTAAMPDAIVVLGPRHEIQWMNDAALNLLDLEPGDVGRPIMNLIRHPSFAEYLHKGRYEIPLQYAPGPGGDLRLAVRVIPYGADQRLLLAQDVTALHRLERVRSDFVANVSHELRTPLTVLSGFVENLQADGSECAGRWERPLALMEQQTTRMQRIVNDLLLLAKLEATEELVDTEMVDVAALLETIRDEARSPDPEAAAPIGLEADPALRLSGNAQELRSAFSNLVFNAVQYTPPDGTITLRAYVTDDHACVEVEDTGEGIAPEHLPRLTERFYRADVGRSRRKGGTGLGLAIVKHVMQHHRGRLEIRSELGRGSLFRCVFPRRIAALIEQGTEGSTDPSNASLSSTGP